MSYIDAAIDQIAVPVEPPYVKHRRIEHITRDEQERVRRGYGVKAVTSSPRRWVVSASPGADFLCGEQFGVSSGLPAHCDGPGH